MRWFLIAILYYLPTIACSGERRIEVGEVDWKRDWEAGFVEAAETGKPVFVLFQEVPGCAGCQKFGREVLSHPQLVEAIETEFVPVVVYNNQPGKDAEILKKYREPAWNFQVVRFLDKEGKDIIERKDRVWSLQGIAARMVEALKAFGQDAPKYLRALAGSEVAAETGTAAFAMYCFWTGELRLGSIEGVLTTEAGWLDGREVTLVSFDREKLPFEELVGAAAQYDCADKVYALNEDDLTAARKSRLSVATLTDDYRRASDSDQKKQLQGTPFEELKLSPVQATKVNSFARTNPEAALEWLSPSQVATLRR
ncbi:MAG: hypothetical protein CMO55_18405 [Verrucomicrobiales bacterium]|nr:hypothetical protein [Verrucomicrobiales bacterium]